MIDVVICNWNSGNSLQICLNSIIKFDKKNINRIIIVDNNSTDKSLHLKKIPSNVKIIKEKKNHGFGKACNIGAAHCKSDLIVFLNPDIEFIEPVFFKIQKTFEQKNLNSIGIVGIKLVDKNLNPVVSYARFPSLKLIFYKIIGLDRVFNKLAITSNYFETQKSLYVDQIIGALFCIKKKIFDELKGFDDRFFLYYEEVDLSFRLKKKGYNSYFLSDKKAIHYGGVSSRKLKISRDYFQILSRYIYIKKHFSYLEKKIHLLLLILIEPLSRFIYIFFNNKKKFSRDFFKVYLKLFR